MNIVQLHNDHDIPFGFDAEDWLADANEEEIEHLGPKIVEAIQALGIKRIVEAKHGTPEALGIRGSLVTAAVEEDPDLDPHEALHLISEASGQLLERAWASLH